LAARAADRTVVVRRARAAAAGLTSSATGPDVVIRIVVCDVVIRDVVIRDIVIQIVILEVVIRIIVGDVVVQAVVIQVIVADRVVGIVVLTAVWSESAHGGPAAIVRSSPGFAFLFRGNTLFDVEQRVTRRRAAQHKQRSKPRSIAARHRGGTLGDLSITLPL
jgi:hypothetical protein